LEMARTILREGETTALGDNRMLSKILMSGEFRELIIILGELFILAVLQRLSKILKELVDEFKEKQLKQIDASLEATQSVDSTLKRIELKMNNGDFNNKREGEY